MNRRFVYQFVAVLTLLSLIVGGCRRSVAPSPTPTVPPYTPAPAGSVPVNVIQRAPDRGEELSLDGVIELVFDRPMDRASVERAFKVNPTLQGNVEWADARTLRFRPARDLARAAEYYVTVEAEARAGDGESLDGAYRFKFRTVGYLEVSQVVPAPGSEDVETTGDVTVMFNRPVVPLMAVSDPDYAGLPQPLTFDPSIAGSGEWLNTSIYVFRPAETLAGGTRYTARVEAGLTDTTGGLLEADYEWTFTTQPPQITWISPQEGADLVGVDTSVQMTFNMPVDCDSAREAFSLQDDGRTTIAGDLACDGASVVFTPTERLPFDTAFTARVDAGVRSQGGGRGMREPYEWPFRTVPLPRIVDTRPADGEEEAPPRTSFDIIFNAPIDPATVLPNLEMTPPISPARVYTYFNRWDQTFVLGFGAQPSTDYEVRIGPDIADPYGNETGQSMTVRFRTAPLDPAAWLLVPGQMGTYDANQPAQIVAGYLNTPRLTFQLHRLEIQDFLTARYDWWDYEPPGDPLREWSTPVESPLNRREHVLVDLVEGGGQLEPGVYLLGLRAEGVEYERWRHRNLLIVSAHNLTVKTSQGEALVWATDLAEGRPLADLQLALLDEAGDAREEATSNADGVARFVLSEREWHGDGIFYSAEPFVLGGVGWEWSAGISPWDFGLQEAGYQPDYRAHIYTDRPIYRPGQTVYFRGVVRVEDDARYDLPDRNRVDVVIRSASGEELYRETLSLDEFGAFHDELALAEGAPLGGYAVSAQIGGQQLHANFQVAAYRPPEFEVVVEPDERALFAGQTTDVAVDVRYFFGGPVADAEIEWRLLTSPYTFQPDQFGRYDFSEDDDPWRCRWCWWWETPSPDVLLSGSGTTNDEGRLTVALPTEVMTGGQELTLEATAYGKDGQAISGRSSLVVHKGAFYAGLAPRQYVGRAGDEMAVDVVTVDWQGRIANIRARLPAQTLDVEIVHREWVNTFVENEVGGSWEWETVDTVVFTDTLTTDANAGGEIVFTPEEGGSYRVAVSGRDAQERPVRSAIWVWVSGEDYVSWRRQNKDQITLISDKSTYVPGETAEILIPSPFTGEHWAWITVERGGVLQQEVLKLESNSTLYRLPITADHAPNVYVSAVIVQGPEAPDASERVAAHKVGYTALTVQPTAQTLNVSLTPSVEQAEPGDRVSFEVAARDAGGEPVAAAFSVDLVDKAVLSLRPRQPNAIVEAFYGRRGLGVSTASGLAISINRLLLEQMEDLTREEEAAQVLGRGGEEMADGEALDFAAEEPQAAPMATMEMEKRAEVEAVRQLPPGVELRETFADTALWDGAVVTDRSGRATVALTLPDNLTTWVFRGVGATIDTEVGEATTELLVTKPLLVRPTTPRFFVVGDRAELAALVSNNTGETLDVEVALQSNGLAVADDAVQTVSIPGGGEAAITWWVTVQDVENVDLTMSAVAGDHADAARPRLTTGPDGTLMVRRYTAPEIVGTGGQLVDEGTRTEVVALPPKYDEREGELTVQLDPSLAAGMREGLDYLEYFPYECVEQTVSRFLPNVLTYRALKDLGLADPELERKLPGLVAEGLSALYRAQNGDGGWGWWPNRESRAYLSGYVLFGLVKAQEAGFDVRGDVIQRGAAYLEGALVPARDLRSYREADRQAFLLYVLAEAGQTRRTSQTGELFRQRDTLNHYGRAFLALTLSLTDENDSRIDTLLADLQNAAILSATGAHWEEANYDRWAMNTDTRSTAVILDALARLDPDNDLIPNVVRWLMVARRDGIWETTQETAWSLIALTDWMVVTGELAGNYEYGVWLNDEALKEGAVTPETVAESIKLRVDVADLLADVGNRLTIGRGPGEGRLYYTAHLKVYLPVAEIEPLDRGIIVSRRYIDPACNEGIKCPEVEQAAVGDVVQVRLTIIAPHDLYYVVVEDPLPAGAEGIDPSLATSSVMDQQPGLYREAQDDWWGGFYHWWWQWYSRSEMRDDRVVLFADYLPAGTYEYTYTFRATRPGEYHVIPTTANEFYFPEVFGRGAGQLFVVERSE
ncbi:MAG TPA: alpha-2-macroglobulin [Chloroflexi bacterium]|nr:alpha-2-macroglobulin [Chloroflexota bacterium]